MPGLQRATAPSRQTWPVPLASLIRMARAGMTGTPGLWPLSGGHPVKFAGPMFVGDELRLGAGLDAARAGLAKLAHRGLLMSISARAYSEGLTGVLWAGSLPSVQRPAFNLVNVHSRDLVMRDDSAVLAVRWEAAGPDGSRFPALDADIILVPAGEAATLLQIIGVYRPPPGPLAAGLDRTILPGVAEATIQAFISRVAGSIGLGSPAARMPGNGEARPVQPGT